jgi:hypothetical protein
MWMIFRLVAVRFDRSPGHLSSKPGQRKSERSQGRQEVPDDAVVRLDPSETADHGVASVAVGSPEVNDGRTLLPTELDPDRWREVTSW